MKLNINRKLLPVKAHFFFFFAALGPILPQLNVFGKQLGVSPAIMGVVTAFLPLFWAAAKPLFGYVVDYWPNRRKQTFVLLILIMSGSYCSLWFLPMPEEDASYVLESIYHLEDKILVKKSNNSTEQSLHKCHWNCSVEGNFDLDLPDTSFLDTVYINDEVTNDTCLLLKMKFSDVKEGHVECHPIDGCDLICYHENIINRTRRAINNNKSMNDVGSKLIDTKDFKTVSNGLPEIRENDENATSLYMTASFWAFVVLMCVGTVAFNVANCIGDAVCFDVLGSDNGSKYGAQRAWGTAGYGLTALLGGWLVDFFSHGNIKNFTPAFILTLIATAVDMECCRGLTLPPLASPNDAGKALRDVLKIPRVLLFIVFAIVAGTFDSFVIYYMFWFLEEIAEQTGHMGQIKFIEGVVIASQSFVGELLFFFFSGKIIKKWGYGTTMTFSLFCYGVRLFLISLIQHPWHLVFIEAIMQGPTYALCYSTIVGYAAHVAPEGYSATVQGIVAGMDDGVGFALGSLVGGVLYSHLGGRTSFLALAVAGAIASGIHAVLFALVTRNDKPKPEPPIEEEDEKMLPHTLPNNAIYRDIAEPLTEEQKDMEVSIR